jgi:integrase
MARAKRARGQGGLFKHPNSNNWYSQVFIDGKPNRVSTGTSNTRLAQNIHNGRLEKVRKDEKIEDPKLTVGDLYQAYLMDSKVNGLHSIDDIEARWKLHLAPVFGKCKPSRVTADMHNQYVLARVGEGAKNATINRESALLKRCFRLAMENEKIGRVPYFKILKEDNTRTGFLEDPSKLRQECVKVGVWMLGIFEIAYAFGWRLFSVITLTAGQVDMTNRCIRLNKSKNGTRPIAYMTPELYSALVPLMFGKSGNDPLFTRMDNSAVKDFRGVWEKMTKAAGVPDLLFHDLRRTAIRNMSRRGLTEKTIMMIAGLKTRSIFDRYNIVCEGDLKAAAEKMSNSGSSVVLAQNLGQSPTPPTVN